MRYNGPSSKSVGYPQMHGEASSSFIGPYGTRIAWRNPLGTLRLSITYYYPPPVGLECQVSTCVSVQTLSDLACVLLQPLVAKRAGRRVRPGWNYYVRSKLILVDL